MSKIQRINLFGGPCCGKSTMASWLFAEFKKEGHKIDFVPEWIKDRAYMGIQTQSFDQFYIFAQQMHKEDIRLRTGMSIIAECPIFLAVAYGIKYNTPSVPSIIAICKEFENHFPSTNFLIDRGERNYQQEGRFENYEQAIHMDNLIKHTMDENNVPYTSIKYNEFATLKRLAIGVLSE